MTQLAVWVVYIKGLAPHPDLHIARRHTIRSDGHCGPTDEIVTGADLSVLRNIMVSKGLIRFSRMPGDDPVIIETWL